jgi:hypothetical protein
LLGEPQDCFENQVSLARHIQAAVEDWFTANEPGTRYGSSEPENERVRGLADLRRDGRIAK